MSILRKLRRIFEKLVRYFELKAEKTNNTHTEAIDKLICVQLFLLGMIYYINVIYMNDMSI